MDSDTRFEKRKEQAQAMVKWLMGYEHDILGHVQDANLGITARYSERYEKVVYGGEFSFYILFENVDDAVLNFNLYFTPYATPQDCIVELRAMLDNNAFRDES